MKLIDCASILSCTIHFVLLYVEQSWLVASTERLHAAHASGGAAMSSQRPRRPKQRRYDPLAVLAYIATYQQSNNQRTPSQRRIQAALDISAPSVVHNIVQRLERDEL